MIITFVFRKSPPPPSVSIKLIFAFSSRLLRFALSSCATVLSSHILYIMADVRTLLNNGWNSMRLGNARGTTSTKEKWSRAEQKANLYAHRIVYCVTFRLRRRQCLRSSANERQSTEIYAQRTHPITISSSLNRNLMQMRARLRRQMFCSYQWALSGRFSRRRNTLER